MTTGRLRNDDAVFINARIFLSMRMARGKNVRTSCFNYYFSRLLEESQGYRVVTLMVAVRKLKLIIVANDPLKIPPKIIQLLFIASST